MVRYCAYIAPPIIETVLPISALAASDDPVLITTPAPSLPTGIDSSSRAAIVRIAASGTFAVTTGASLVPDAFAVDISAAPTRRPRSDGLIGEASTRTTTSSVGRLGRRDAGQRYFEFAALLDQRAKLQPGLAVTHTHFLPAGGPDLLPIRALLSDNDMVAVGNDVNRHLQGRVPIRGHARQAGALHSGNSSQKPSCPASIRPCASTL